MPSSRERVSIFSQNMESNSSEQPLSFSDLDLSPIMLRALQICKFETPSPIQAGLIPLALEGEDVIGQARTGTGKTAAFGIPILEQLDPLEDCCLPQALILVPTRELADQVGEELTRLAKGVPTSIAVLAGGKNLRKQTQQLQDGVQVVVGTPGRVHDHLQRGTFKTHDVWCVVLDEADRMLDIGFRPQIERILRKCPKDRQTLLLSATMAPQVRILAERYMYEPKTVDCSSKDMSVETIEQHYFTVDADKRLELLMRLLDRETPEQVIIFCRTKRGTDKLHRKLSEKYKGVGCMHGDMQQRERDRVIKQLRSKDLKVLVATDVVGRGIDITTISHIINFDVPQDCDDYVHRVGRTGRMGRDGVAFTFIVPGEGDVLTSIEQRINKQLIKDVMDGFDHPVPVNRAAQAEEEAKPKEPGRPKLNRIVRHTRKRF